MSKTLNAIRAMPHVFAVDDERNCGNSIIVTLKDGFEFLNDPGCGVCGFNNVREAMAGSSRHAVFKAPHTPLQ